MERLRRRSESEGTLACPGPDFLGENMEVLLGAMSSNSVDAGSSQRSSLSSGSIVVVAESKERRQQPSR